MKYNRNSPTLWKFNQILESQDKYVSFINKLNHTSSTSNET